jgi:acyl-CoA dehydrogenase
LITLEQFEQDARAFLERELGAAGTTQLEPPATDVEAFERSRDWQRKRYDAGFGWIQGPREYWGAELSEDHERLFVRLEREYGAPPLGPTTFALAITSSAIHAHGPQATRDKYLRALFRGDIVACQLFSEPGSGSDLASVSTRAVRDGDGWVINGQKVWTSSGHLCDVGLCVSRTDMDAPKHQGVSLFMVDMRHPGVDVRPLINAAGERHFNEVFLTDVRVDDVDLVGELNNGWRTLNTSLMNERAYVGNMNESAAALSPDKLIPALRTAGVLEDPYVRNGLAELIVRYRAAEYLQRQINQKLETGETPGPEMSATKLTFSENQNALVDFAARALGHPAAAADGDDEVYEWATHLIKGRSIRIAGGTDEIQRTIIGEKVLRLPKDPAIDNSIPFKDIPRSAKVSR